MSVRRISTYKCLEKGLAAVALRERVPLNVAFIDIINQWEGDNVSPERLHGVEELLYIGRSSNKMRLLIRLAILQALVDERKPLTFAELRAYWRDVLPGKLTHSKALETYARAKRVHLHDVAALAGVPIPDRKDPAPHPRPPLEIVYLDEQVEAGRSLTQEERDETARLLATANLDVELEREAVRKVRENQGLFRTRVETMWDSRCAVTGVSNRMLLVASHIKPWRCCEIGEHLDGNNGLLLVPTLDRLFDQGLMTFGEDGIAIFSSQIESTERSILPLPDKVVLRKGMTPSMVSYMFYHRAEVFRP